MSVSHQESPMPADVRQRAMALVNPQAGTFAGQQEFLPQVQAAGGIVRSLASPRDLETALWEAERDQIKRLIVVGGDGSVSHAMNALRGDLAKFELAVVPAGTGNDLARSLAIPLDDLSLAWQQALHGSAVPIDLIQLAPSDKLCVNGITAGFGGHPDHAVARDQKSSWGKFAYWLTAVSKMRQMRDFRITITTLEFSQELTVLGFWIINGCYVGGGFSVAPTALLDDGMFDVVAIPAGDPLGLLSAGVEYAVIGPEQSTQILTFRAKSIQISTDPQVALSIDGEPWVARHLECRILPTAVRVVVGTAEAALSAMAAPPISQK
jgi:YegS/Rv2252/BmrU family lipid kinase